MSKLKTQEEFIKELKNVFGNKYDYSKVNYINNKNKITLICPIHGEFSALPSNLLKGYGCSLCGRRNYSDEKSFIAFCKEKYGEKYSYEKVNYVNSSTKVIIHCNVHDFDFEITPNNFTRGKQCPKCSKRYRYKTDDFIEEAKKIHGEKYDYSKVVYKNMKTPIVLGCPIHGDFTITPVSHIHKQAGCILCGYEEMKKKQRFTTEEIIEQFRKAHGNEKYDYSKVKYVNAFTPVLIHCNKHNYDFFQIPDAHKRGVGCPKCNERVLEKRVEEMLNGNFEYRYNYKDKRLNGLSFDFFIPCKNIAIECQGEQHYFPVDFSGKGKEWAEKMFKNGIGRDENKRRLCKENNIELIYFLDSKLEKYEKSGNRYFTNTEDLINYIKEIKKDSVT